MYIKIITQYYEPDNFRINDIARELVGMGHNVEVLTGLPDYATSRIPAEYKWRRRRKELLDGVEVRRVPIIARRTGVIFRGLNYLSFVVTASARVLLSPPGKCDVILVNQTSPVFQAIPAILLKTRLNKKLILYCYDLWPLSLEAWKVKPGNPVYRITKGISRWIYQSCDQVLITSTPFREYLQEVCRVEPERIRYLPQYAEDLFCSVAQCYEENGCVDFLFAGNIGAVQDVDCILRAAALVNPAHRFQVHIVGDGSELPRLKELAGELGLLETVLFHGRYPLSEMERFYKLADCFLLSLAEGLFELTLPAKAQSYLCTGKPILAAIGGAGREMMLESGCGEVVPPGDSRALAQKMEAIITNPGLYRERGRSGLRYYREHYTKTKFFETLIQALV